MNLQKSLNSWPKRWLVVGSIIALAGITAASCHGPDPHPTPRPPCCTPPAPPPSPPPSTPPANGLAQWTQQYGGDIENLLQAVNTDMSNINIAISSCNSNSQFCITADCSDTVNAANRLQQDLPAPDASISNALSTGANQLAMAAGQCSSVQGFIPGYANITNAAQTLGLPTGG